MNSFVSQEPKTLTGVYSEQTNFHLSILSTVYVQASEEQKEAMDKFMNHLSKAGAGHIFSVSVLEYIKAEVLDQPLISMLLNLHATASIYYRMSCTGEFLGEIRNVNTIVRSLKGLLQEIQDPVAGETPECFGDSRFLASVFITIDGFNDIIDANPYLALPYWYILNGIWPHFWIKLRNGDTVFSITQDKENPGSNSEKVVTLTPVK